MKPAYGFAERDHDYRNGPDSDYKLAWEIVQAEGYQRFIQELKSSR